MKRFILSMTMLLTVALSSMAMSYEQARDRALFLTDKMAYELNLNDEQYEAAYEVNLDYLMSINTYDDLYGTYWTRRNLDLSYILFDWQYDAFCAAAYFYRPLTWTNGCWHFGIYTRYPVRTYFYFGRPAFYNTYCGGHSWRMNNGRSWYHGRTFGPRPSESRFGMRDRFDRGDFRGPGQGNGRFDRNEPGRPGNGGQKPGNNRGDNGNKGNNGGFNRGDNGNKGNNGGFNRGNGSGNNGGFNNGNGNVFRNGNTQGRTNGSNSGITRKDNTVSRNDDVFSGSTSQANTRRQASTISGNSTKSEGSTFTRRPQTSTTNSGITRRESSTRFNNSNMTNRSTQNVAPSHSMNQVNRSSIGSSSSSRAQSTFTPSRSTGGSSQSSGSFSSGSSRGGSSFSGGGGSSRGGGGHFGGRR